MTKLGVLFVFLAACGGGSGGSGDTSALSVDRAQDLCDQVCEHEVSCGDEVDVASCSTRCVDEFAGWARTDAVETLVSCATALACTENDDRCFLEIEPLAIHEEWEGKCRAQLAECVQDPSSLDTLCEVSPDPANEVGFFRLIAPEVMTELIDCLDGADCNARINCVQASLEAHGIDS